MKDTFFLGRGAGMRQLLDRVGRLARNRETRVLVWGEPGTGKRWVAEALHHRASPAGKPFLVVSCARALPDTLEVEFSQAREGTVFLDEIGEMELHFQGRLLSALDSQPEVRVIASTHRDLLRLVETGAFRRDLFRGLSAAIVRIPPLRERREDIPLLAAAFLRRARRGTEIKGFTPDALELLVQASWTGNIRQLKNVVERGCLACESAWVEMRHLLPELEAGVTDGFGQNMSLRQLSRLYAGIVVNRVQTKAQACEILGITDKTLNRLLREDASP